MPEDLLTLFNDYNRTEVSVKTLICHWKTICERYRVVEITIRTTGCETRDSQHAQALSRACKNVVVRILDTEDYLLVIYKNGAKL